MRYAIEDTEEESGVTEDLLVGVSADGLYGMS